jgi:hypothetical protein
MRDLDGAPDQLIAIPACALPELRWPLYLLGAFVVGAALALLGVRWLGAARPW